MMAMTSDRRNRSGERGVALVMVILLLLVLTVLGITATMMMTQEDRISARQESQKAAFYAADAGLRQGESMLQNNVPFSNDNLTKLLSHVSTTKTPAVSPELPVAPPGWDLAHLGTYLTTAIGGGTEFADQEVTQQVGGGTFDRVRAYYSLYVRNNPEDLAPGGVVSPLVNYDTRLRLVAVGFVTDHNGVDPTTGAANVLAVKILEEELNWAGQSGKSGGQADSDAGATNSGQWAGGS
jgi:PilX N-terminal